MHHPKSLIPRHLPLFIRLVALIIPCAVFGQLHPRLLVDTADLPELRDRLAREPYASMYAELVYFAEIDDTAGVEYGQSSAAVNCAFLYLLTGDDAWAAKARMYAEMRLTDTSTSHGWDMNIKGLSLYWHGRAVALAYDFCHSASSWNTAAGLGGNPTEPFIDYVRTKLKAQGDRIYTSGGTEQNTSPASNWQNNRFASAGIIYLAIEESLSEADKARIDGCMQKVRTYLVQNMGADPDSRGNNIEAIGYQMYPWGFTGPFAIAAERLGYGVMGEAAPAAAAYALWNVYSYTARIPHVWGDHYGIHNDFGDDNNTHRGEGAYGLAFYFCPEFLHAGLRYWYDRIVGGQGDQTWDRERMGTIYSLLYYRDDVTPAEPDSIREWANAMIETGGNGYFSFRDRYQDNDDIVAQLYAKFRGNAGHSGPDALSFRIVGLDAPFAVGGGRYGIKTASLDTGVTQDVFNRSMNTLYPVNPDNQLTISGYSGILLGVPQRFPDGGGSVSLSIPVNNVNTRNHTRRFLADYSGASGASAVYVISDTSDDGNWWQYCQVDLDPLVQAITVDGNTFTVANPNGTSLRATVIYPAGDLQWTTGTRLRGSGYGYYGVSYNSNEFVHFRSADGDYLVVMTVCDAGVPHPAVSDLAGGGANNGRVLQVGGLQVAVDGDHISRGASLQIPPAVVVETPLPQAAYAPGPHDLDVAGRVFAGSAAPSALEVYYGEVSEYLGDGALDTATGNFNFTIPDLPIGQHLFRVRAVDANGLGRYSDYIPFSIHLTQPPLVSITSLTNHQVLSPGGLVPITVEASDPDAGGGISAVDIRVDGVSRTVTGAEPWEAQLDTSVAGAYRVEALATDASGETGQAQADVYVSLAQLPAPWVHFDVGAVAAAGSASLDSGTLTMAGSGADIWNAADEMHYAFQQVSGNKELVVQVLSQQNTNSWAKAGPVFRAAARAGSPYAGLFVTPGNGVVVQKRETDGGASSNIRLAGVTAPVWLRLVRKGTYITGYYRKVPSDPWTMVGAYAVDLPEEAQAGLAVCSHSDGVLSTAQFGSFSISLPNPAPAPDVTIAFTPGSGLHASWMTVDGVSYRKEISSDMKTWVPYGLSTTGDDSTSEEDLGRIRPPLFLRVTAQ